MKTLIASTLLAFALSTLCLAQSTTEMEDGSIVRIDPDTNKAIRYSDQGSTQLWDGVHRSQDGSVITIQGGVVTSISEGGGQAPTLQQPVPSGMFETSPCAELVVKVCGFNGECHDGKGCSPARQLMGLERDEAWQSNAAGANQTTAMCRDSLADEKLFPPCRVNPVKTEPTPCDRLVTRVCGTENQCIDSPACRPAHQLVEMEQGERERRRNPNRLTYSSKKCLEAINDADFFTPCDQKGDEKRE